MSDRKLEQLDEDTAGVRVTIRPQEPDGSPATFETRDRAVLEGLAELLKLRPPGSVPARSQSERVRAPAGFSAFWRRLPVWQRRPYHPLRQRAAVTRSRPG